MDCRSGSLVRAVEAGNLLLEFSFEGKLDDYALVQIELRGVAECCLVLVPRYHKASQDIVIFKQPFPGLPSSGEAASTCQYFPVDRPFTEHLM